MEQHIIQPCADYTARNDDKAHINNDIRGEFFALLLTGCKKHGDDDADGHQHAIPVDVFSKERKRYSVRNCHGSILLKNIVPQRVIIPQFMKIWKPSPNQCRANGVKSSFSVCV